MDKNHDKTKPIFSWTGNPFVDTGLMVIAHLANKNDISELSYEDVTRVFGDGRELASMNAKLKSFTMVFGRNGPLTNGTIEVLPSNKLEEYKNRRENGLWIEADNLLVPIRARSIYKFGKLLNLKEDPPVIYIDYNEIGLTDDAINNMI